VSGTAESKLGIIIPTYDNLDMLKRLVKQIYNYTEGKLLVVVVEDGQKPQTMDWLSRRGMLQSNFIPLFNKENLGVAPSWNEGLRYCYNQGCDYFAVFNDDIEIPKNWWKICRPEFEGNVHVVSTRKDRRNPVLTGWFFILDRYAIDTVGYFDEQFAPFHAEDGDWIRRMLLARVGYKMIWVDVVHHFSTTTDRIRHEDPDRYHRVNVEAGEKMKKKWGDTGYHRPAKSV
jgi:GT2 family glycosyltransferase